MRLLNNLDGASRVVQDASNRFITDAERTTWNAKASTSVATTGANGLMSSTDKLKLNGVADNANNYSHPTGDGSSHIPATGTSNSGKVLMAGATANSFSWQDLSASAVAATLSGSGAFPGSTTSVTISDADIKSTSFVIVSPTGSQAGFWEANTSSGNFTVSSTATEASSATFNWAIIDDGNAGTGGGSATIDKTTTLSVWDPTVSYPEFVKVIGLDGTIWESQQNNNINHEPTTRDAWWGYPLLSSVSNGVTGQVLGKTGSSWGAYDWIDPPAATIDKTTLIAKWDATVTYGLYDQVLDDNGVVWTSQQANNLNHAITFYLDNAWWSEPAMWVRSAGTTGQILAKIDNQWNHWGWQDPTIVVSATNPNLTSPGLWVQTGLGGGSDFTFWIEDGV